jgi:hypothetical protein
MSEEKQEKQKRYDFSQQKPVGRYTFQPKGIQPRAQPSEYKHPRTIEEATLDILKSIDSKLDAIISIIKKE